ncbi:hypothetical protein EUGRSUZ_A02957 [Eucalyptus grandis]|uniref:Uncharacterized protein n=2 Tax=Eucalyptus grandis TaxID=71139 RepID=A0ACC3M9T2_EUCGR|nr:hypothetical protein EUGRSUZ_A02957 [Eucalyptus grandis]
MWCFVNKNFSFFHQHGTRIRKIASLGDDTRKSTGDSICAAGSVGRQDLAIPRSVSDNKDKDLGSVRFLFCSVVYAMNWLNSKMKDRL